MGDGVSWASARERSTAGPRAAAPVIPAARRNVRRDSWSRPGPVMDSDIGHPLVDSARASVREVAAPYTTLRAETRREWPWSPLASRTLLVSCRGSPPSLMTAASSSPRFERSGSTVRIPVDGERIALTVCTSRIIRVALENGAPAAAPSYVGERSWPAVAFQVGEGESLRLTTADLAVEASVDAARLSFLDAAGRWLLREPEHGDGARPEPADAHGRRRVHAAFE